MSNFRPINRDTGFLLPPLVDEWLPQRHLARFVVEVIDGLDLSALVKAYRGSGIASYHPAMLLGLLVYGYATKVFSSRAIERATHDSVAFRYIAGNEHPDHDTIAAFRKRFVCQLGPLFLEVLKLARDLGADAQDIPDGMSIPEELERRELRLAAIAAAKAKIEARAAQRLACEQVEHQSKLAARAEQEQRTGKRPRGRTPEPPTGGVKDKDQVNLTPALGGCYVMQAASGQWEVVRRGRPIEQLLAEMKSRAS